MHGSGRPALFIAFCDKRMHMASTVSTRIPSDLMQAVEDLEAWTHRKRSDVLRDALALGLAEERLVAALADYREGRASLGRAAERAQLPLGTFLDRLRQRGVLMPYDLHDLAEDLAWAKQ